MALVALGGAAAPAVAQSPLQGVQSLGAAPGYQGVEPGGTYRFDLKTRSFQAALPFDVNFFIQGPVGDGFERVSARFVEFRRPPNCPGFFRPVDIFVARGDDLVAARGIPVRVRRPARAVEATPLLEAVLFGQDGSREFRIEFPPLRPNRYYCFEFISRQSLDEETLAALRQKFVGALDAALRVDELSRPLSDLEEERTVAAVETLEEYQQLRMTLIGIVEDQLEPGQTLLVQRGTFFHDDTDFDAIPRKWREQFDRVLEKSVDQRQDAIREVGDSLERARQALAELATMRFPAAGGQRTLVEMLSAPPDRSAERVAARLRSVEERTEIDLIELLQSARVGTLDRLRTPDLDGLWKEDQFSNLNDVFVELLRVSNAVAALPDLARLAGIDEDQLIDTLAAGAEGGEEVDFDPNAPEPEVEITLASLVASAVDELGDNSADSTGATLQLFDLRDVLRRREQLLEELSHQLSAEIREVVRVSGTTVANFDTRALWYMSADIGSGFAWDTEDVFAYLGWNLYFRPMNKKSHLSWRSRPFGARDEFLRRFAVTLGLVWSGFDEQDGQFQGVVGDRAAVLGAGFRINDAVRLSVGGLIFENENPDPLISSTSLNWTPYAAISFDWNATKTFADIFKGFGGGATQVVTPAPTQ